MQDDYGNLLLGPSTTKIADRLDKGDADRLAMSGEIEAVKQALAENTTLTKATADNTQDLVEFFTAFKGAFKVLDYVGKLAKPLGYILAVGTAIAGLWTTFKAGR